MDAVGDHRRVCREGLNRRLGIGVLGMLFRGDEGVWRGG